MASSSGTSRAYDSTDPTPAIREPVMRYALCDGTLLEELGFPKSQTVAVELEPLPGTSLGELQTRFEVDCR